MSILALGILVCRKGWEGQRAQHEHGDRKRLQVHRMQSLLMYLQNGSICQFVLLLLPWRFHSILRIDLLMDKDFGKSPSSGMFWTMF